MSTSTTGTGTITLGAAEDGYQTFADAGVANADAVRYVIEDGSNWEIGTGAYTASGTTLSRNVIESSNSDAAINLSGDGIVFIGATAEDIPVLYAENYDGTSTLPIATDNNALSLGRVSTSTGTNSVSIGSSSFTNRTDAVAIGPSATAQSIGGLALGHDATVMTGAQAVAIGDSYASGADSFAAAIANNSSTYGAQGANSIAIGKHTKATGAGAVALGFSNTASQSYAFATGRSSTASGFYSTVLGGNYNHATAFQACILNGRFAIAAHDYSTAIGSYARTRADYAVSFGSFGFSYAGAAQSSLFTLVSDTTDATPEALTSNKSSPATDNQVILPNNGAYAFHGTIVARQQASAGTASAGWKVEGLIRREANAGTTVLVNSATTILDNTPSWGLALSADTTNGGLKIEVTGAASTNIRWVATIHTSEVIY